jgi:SAM-dependent methyltransferase
MRSQLDAVAGQMKSTYDRYFLSSGYQQRYPRPNVGTLDFLLENGARNADCILDFGCGNGRYSLALLEHSQATLTAYDISAPSLAEFESRLRDTPYRERVTFVHDDWKCLEETESPDLILMLFGVLSHIGDSSARIETLSRLRRLIREDGRLILSVPSVFRRRPGDMLKSTFARRLGLAKAPLNESGNIYFTREVNGDLLTFFYHLYTLKRLRAELAAAGFAIRHCEAESVLPEWLLMRSKLLCAVDHALSAWIPPELGYGIRVLATPV